MGEKDARTLAGNFVSLIIVQGTNFLLPIFVLPFLVARLGLDRFGLVAFSQALAIYWIMFIDYGYNLSATREVALFKEDLSQVSVIVSRTLVAKAALTLVAVVVMLILTFSIPQFRAEKLLYLLLLTMIVGQSLTPVWFFQGMEQMKFVTYINLLSKIMLAVLIFVLIRKPADYPYVSLYYGVANLVAGIIGIIFMFRRFHLKFGLPPGFTILGELRQGWHIFLNHFAINICSNSNIFILGLVAPDYIVGLYSIAEKIISIARQLLQIFFQTTYPAVCKTIRGGHQAVLRFFKKFYLPFTLLILAVLVVILIAAPFIVTVFAHTPDPRIVLMLRWLTIVPLMHCLNIPAFQTLLAYEYQKSTLKVYGLASLINISLNFILAIKYSMYGTVAAVIITETFVMLGLHYVLHRYHPSKRLLSPN